MGPYGSAEVKPPSKSERRITNAARTAEPMADLALLLQHGILYGGNLPHLPNSPIRESA